MHDTLLELHSAARPRAGACRLLAAGGGTCDAPGAASVGACIIWGAAAGKYEQVNRSVSGGTRAAKYEILVRSRADFSRCIMRCKLCGRKLRTKSHTVENTQ